MFGKIAVPLISMLKTIMLLQMFGANEMLGAKVFATNEVIDIKDSDRSKRIKLKTRRSKSQNSAKSQKLSKSGKSKGKKSKKPSKSGNLPNFDAREAGPSFLTAGSREAFNRLRLVFTKAPILQHFDPKCHIWIETNVLGYAISIVLSQLVFEIRLNGVVTKTDLSHWHPVGFFLKKMIPVEIWYKIHNGELLAIVEAFKTWQHYLESCKHEVFVLTNNNNLCRFIDIKNMSSRQVRWAQELSWYHFRID